MDARRGAAEDHDDSKKYKRPLCQRRVRSVAYTACFGATLWALLVIFDGGGGRNHSMRQQYVAQRHTTLQLQKDVGEAGTFAFSHALTLKAAGGHGDPVRRRQKDLVIGVAKDLKPEQLAVFCGSWRQHSDPSQSDLVVFVNGPVSSLQQAILERWNVTAQVFQQDLLLPEQLRSFHPSTFRWPLIYEFLRTHGGYRRVLLADVRDMMFQRDAFAAVMPEDDDKSLHVFRGVESRPIGKDGWNGGWVKSCFGESVLKELYHRPIICSGITMGAIKAVEAYVTLMTKRILDPDFATCERNGVDQGVHNVIVHRLEVPNTVISDQQTGLVANLQAGLARIEGDNRVVNTRDQLYAVVHQYDRNRRLQDFYFSRYRFWDKQQSVDTTGACSPFALEHDVDLFKGECDVFARSGLDLSGCCKLCQAEADCSSFTHHGHMCYLKTCRSRGGGGKRLAGAVSGIMAQK